MIEVLSAGMYTTIQDLGRFGYGNIGVPVSGAMDLYASRLANQLLGNAENDAVLEITLGGCKLVFKSSTFICISGADLSAKINNNSIPLHSVIKVEKGSILTFNKPKYGVRAYLAVQGGFQSETILGSKSFYKNITSKYLVKKNDYLKIAKIKDKKKRGFSTVKILIEHFKTKVLDVYKGPEYELLSVTQKEQLKETEFTISNENNRMGYRLKELINNKLPSMLTSAVLTGTVQLTPSGSLIILMRDCQVTGGYPRILQLTDMSINRLAQKTTRDRVLFNMINLT